MTKPKLTVDYTVEEVAEALRMSERWVRDQYRLHGAEHQRYGRIVRFTPDQVEQLRARCSSKPVDPVVAAPPRITTGRLKFAG